MIGITDIFGSTEQAIKKTGLSIEQLNTIDSVPVQTTIDYGGFPSDYDVGSLMNSNTCIDIAGCDSYYKGNIQFWKGIIDSRKKIIG